jgi:succinoglycan biosynthesis protein ExoO
VVDDASTDATSDVVRSYEPSGRVRLLVNECNRGPSHSRNRAIEAARGEWVLQLDGDDWMAPDRVERLLAAAQEADVDLVTDDLLVVDDGTSLPVSTRYVDKNIPWTKPTRYALADLLHYDLGSVKPLMRRGFLLQHGLRYPEHLRYGEDFVFLLRAFRAGALCLALPEALYRLRRGNTGSLTTQKEALYRETERVTAQLLADAEVMAQPEVREALASRQRYLRQLASIERLKAARRARGWPGVLALAASEPQLAWPLLQRLPAMLSKRGRRGRQRRGLAPFTMPLVQGPQAFIPTSKRA